MNVSLVTKKIKIAYGVSTNNELALKLGISISAIEQWSKKKKIPEKYFFKCINEAGVSMEWLLDEDKPTFDIDKNKSTNLKSDNDIDENTLNLINTIYGFAKTNNRTVELKEDLKQLLNKYI